MTQSSRASPHSRNSIARDLRTPKYRKRVARNKKKLLKPKHKENYHGLASS